MSGIMLALAAGVIPLSITVTPPSSDAGGYDNAPSLPSVTAFVAGGSGTYTYVWTEIVISLDATLAFGNPYAQSTSLSLSGVGPGKLIEGVVMVTATDTVGGATASAEVPYSYTRFD